MKEQITNKSISKQQRINENDLNILDRLSEEFSLPQTKLLSKLIANQRNIINLIDTIFNHLDNNQHVYLKGNENEYIGLNSFQSNRVDIIGNNLDHLRVYQTTNWQISGNRNNYTILKYTLLNFYNLSNELVDTKSIIMSNANFSGFEEIYNYFQYININNLNIELTK